jgi:hypothetical protein
MKALLLLGMASLTTSAQASGHRGGSRATGSHSVSGYTTKKGTYVKPHQQTNPDHTQKNNYSTKGNANPWTGKKGSKSATH